MFFRKQHSFCWHRGSDFLTLGNPVTASILQKRGRAKASSSYGDGNCMGCFSARPSFAPPAKWHGQYVAVFFPRKKRVFEQKEVLLSGKMRDFRDLAIVFSAKLMVHGVKDMSLLLIHFWSPVSEKSLSLFPCPKERPKGKRLKELNGRRRYRFFPLFLLPFLLPALVRRK